MTHLRQEILIILLALALVLALAHHAAFEHFLYWRYWWFDRLMHFGAGFLIAGLTCWYFRYEWPALYSRYAFFIAIFLTAVVGTAWEVFEYSIGYTHFPSLVPDTRYDMLMNILGALTACAMMGWWGQEKSQ